MSTYPVKVNSVGPDSINAGAALGSRAKRFNSFPMLVKVISGENGVGVQIHPSEACMTRSEKQYGKAKYWCAVEYFIPENSDWAVCKSVMRCEAQENGAVRETQGQSLFTAEKNGNIITHLAHDKYFSVYDLRFKREMRMTMNERSFNALTFIRGEGTLECGGVEEKFAAGDSFFIPCPAAGYVIKGAGTALMFKLEGENTHKTL